MNEQDNYNFMTPQIVWYNGFSSRVLIFIP